MPQMVEDVTKFVSDLATSLLKDGKATVDVKKEANGNPDLASNLLRHASREADLEIDIKANKTSAIALVKGDSAEDEAAE